MSEKKIQVTLGNYKGVEVKKAEIIITEEEVKAELERARQYAVTTQDKDGAAELGDEAVIDFVGYIDGEAFAGGDGTDFPLKLGSNTFIPGFEDQLVGAKKDDNVDVVVTFPEDYHAAEFAGKEATFKVTVKGVRSSFLPELSDEVVQKISQCKTVAEFEEYAAKDALSMLKGQAVLQEIAKAEGFSYTDEDVDQTIAAMAMSYQMPAEQLREMMGERGVAMVAEDILSKQALEFIVKEAVEA